jgi:hypothetical protein
MQENLEGQGGTERLHDNVRARLDLNGHRKGLRTGAIVSTALTDGIRPSNMNIRGDRELIARLCTCGLPHVERLTDSHYPITYIPSVPIVGVCCKQISPNFLATVMFLFFRGVSSSRTR